MEILCTNVLNIFVGHIIMCSLKTSISLESFYINRDIKKDISEGFSIPVGYVNRKMKNLRRKSLMTKRDMHIDIMQKRI
jgi:hypothetical protein